MIMSMPKDAKMYSIVVSLPDGQFGLEATNDVPACSSCAFKNRCFNYPNILLCEYFGVDRLNVHFVKI